MYEKIGSRSQCKLSGWAVLFFVVLCVNMSGMAAEDDGFVPLFNGKNLDGWSGDSRLWAVRDGVIVGSTHGVKLEHNSFLATEKRFSDFVLRVKVKLDNHNSGIQFRSETYDDYVVKGYQADVAESVFFGMLYDEGFRGSMDYWKALPDEERKAIHATGKQGDWNEYEIECVGDRVKMTLNGKVTCDIVDPDGRKEGVVALQLHLGPEMVVQFKDLYIKVLPEKE